MKRYVIPLLIGFILLGCGGCYLWFEITDFTWINQVPSQVCCQKEDTYEFQVEEGGNYRFIGNDSIIELKTSDELIDKMIVNVYSYEAFTSVKYYENSYYESQPVKNIIFYRKEDDAWNTLKNMKEIILADIQSRTIHNYNLLIQPKIIVTVPTALEERVTIVSAEDEMAEYFDENV